MRKGDGTVAHDFGTWEWQSGKDSRRRIVAYPELFASARLHSVNERAQIHIILALDTFATINRWELCRLGLKLFDSHARK